jgi:hypothetical protein
MASPIKRVIVRDLRLCLLLFGALSAAWGTTWRGGGVGVRTRRLQQLRSIRVQWRLTAFRLIVRGYGYAQPAVSCRPQDLADTFSSVMLRFG